ncbi:MULTISPECIES: hypothetical protein [unclassified Lentimonas]|uniref:hypothetical protein n=1 Tax=unclassified Lentimonas TaxID=2630993 RepID=UPI001321A9B9|nr:MULTISPECIES: hypothetical protein [unclassified Lentimonas]CAA6680185.1 Unannotated [Lentimonas sp. CC4]CAA6687061.1 Unannotated [Lentimonas sp. CC6]CAA7076165.1 Unannotated [Lentimonas sp. CC4]CAA7171186.1 Unannotated [Lentimonas sp. CC21]CAA7182767.1 Unannotated [Lentimonas sp. CC8]
MNTPKYRPFTLIALAPLLLAPLLSSAEVLTLNPLTNGNFEQNDLAAGEHTELAGWVKKAGTNVKTVETAGFDATWANTLGAESQVGMVWINSGSSTSDSQWFYQKLTGTSTGNGTSHDLTVGEASGQQIAMISRIGIESFDAWPNQHALIRIGLQDSSNTWMGDQFVYTGTSDEAAAAPGGAITADVYLVSGRKSLSSVLMRVSRQERS